MENALGYSPYNTCVGSWYEHAQSFCRPFSPAQEVEGTQPLLAGYSCFQLVLMLTITSQSYTVKQSESSAPSFPMRPVDSIASPRSVWAWYRNINLFLFWVLHLKLALRID